MVGKVEKSDLSIGIMEESLLPATGGVRMAGMKINAGNGDYSLEVKVRNYKIRPVSMEFDSDKKQIEAEFEHIDTPQTANIYFNKTLYHNTEFSRRMADMVQEIKKMPVTKNTCGLIEERIARIVSYSFSVRSCGLQKEMIDPLEEETFVAIPATPFFEEYGDF